MTLLAPLLFTMALSLGSPVPDGPPPSATCSASMLNGRYGFVLNGQHVGIGNYGLIGIFDVDGTKEIKGKGTQTINGERSGVSFTGTFSVEDDCTGKADLLFKSGNLTKVLFVIVADGREVLLMDAGGHTIEMGYAKSMDIHQTPTATAGPPPSRE